MLKHILRLKTVLWGLPWILLLLWPLPRGIAQAGDTESPALTATLQPTSARVGDVVLLTLGYRLPEGAKLPEKPEIRGLEGVMVLSVAQDADRIDVRLLVDRLAPWTSGRITLAYLSADGSRQEVSARPVTLAVTSNLGEKPDEAALKPLRGIVPASAWRTYLPWIAAAAAALLLAALLIWWLNKRRAISLTPEIQEPPHVRARRSIEQLAARRLFEAGYVKEFYFAFSEIVRRYLGAVRHFPAAEFTTEEIAQSLVVDQDRALLPLLRRTDLIKFADDIPTASQKEDDIRTALSYIKTTTPVVETETAADRPGRAAP